jgi:hypothetical protein
MPECLDIVGLRWASCADVECNVLGRGLETVQSIPQVLPRTPGDQHVFGTEFAALRLTTCLVCSLAVGRAAVALWTTGPTRDLEPSPAPRAMSKLFCHSDAILFDLDVPAGDHTSRRPINTKLAEMQPTDATIVTTSDRQ